MTDTRYTEAVRQRRAQLEAARAGAKAKQAVRDATGTTNCPYCGCEYRPGVPTVLRCPLCRSEQNGRTAIDGGIATCPDCGGAWLAGEDAARG